MFDTSDPSFNRTRRGVVSLFLAAACGLAAPSVAQSDFAPSPAEYRGTNYFPSTTLSMSNALAMLSTDGASFRGAFSPTQLNAEISEIAKAGFNVVRIFPSFYGWVTNSAEYMQNLRTLAKTCRRWRIGITYVVWNTTSNVFVPVYLGVDPGFPAHDTNLHQALQQIAAAYTMDPEGPPLTTIASLGEPWQMVLHDQPGNGLFQAPYHGDLSAWPNNLGPKARAYLDDIGNFFANDPVGREVFCSYDLFNEPDCCPAFLNQIPLMQESYGRLTAAHSQPGAPKAEFTVGFADYTQIGAFHDQLVAAGIKQTYLSYHCYEARPSFTAVAQNLGNLGQQLSMPVVCSEFYDRNKPGHLGMLGMMLTDLEQNGIAGQVWGYLSTNLIFDDDPAPDSENWIRLDGMLIPQAVPNVMSFWDPVFFLLNPGSGFDALAVKLW